jgi:hypothetical protein
MSPATLLAALNDLGRDNGIGRLDLVENRFVGMKSRGVYETPGGTILLAAHRAMESITLDRGAAHLKDELMPRYAELIYNGFWFSPEREMLQAAIDLSSACRRQGALKLYKGNVIVTGRRVDKSLYSEELVTFEDDHGAYDQKDAAGFIRLNALRSTSAAGSWDSAPSRIVCSSGSGNPSSSRARHWTRPGRSGWPKLVKPWLASVPVSARMCWPTRRTGSCCLTTGPISTACRMTCAPPWRPLPRTWVTRGSSPLPCRARSSNRF